MVDFITDRESGFRRVAASTADGKADQDAVRLAKRVLNLAPGRIECVADTDFVQQLIVNKKPDALLIPVHPPDMKVLFPTGVFEAR